MQRLSQWEDRISLTRAFRDDLADIEAREGEAERFAHEPFRRKLFFVHRFLTRARARLVDGEPVEGYPGGADGFRQDLERIAATLEAGQGRRAARAFVRPVVQRARRSASSSPRWTCASTAPSTNAPWRSCWPTPGWRTTTLG